MKARDCIHCALLGVAFVVSMGNACTTARAAEDKSWANSAYNVQLQIAVDSSRAPGLISLERLASELELEIRNQISPLWKVEVVRLNGAEGAKLFAQFIDLEQHAEDFAGSFDKQMFLTVQVTPSGLRIACRERDRLTNRWTPPLERIVRQELLLSQQCFEILCETFAPLAQVQVDSEDEQYVTLDMKGAELARSNGEELFVFKDAIYQPLLMRMKRGDSSTAGHVLTIPWTYLTVEEQLASSWKCVVHSGTRRPFGGRRRAGIETIALAIKPNLPATRVRFHANHDASLPLSGYEVFQKKIGDSSFTPLAMTDIDGSIVVERAGFPVTMLALRSDKELLAQFPVVPGAVAEMEVPIADDMARLLVQESLTSFKEQLIDVVARRNILMARIRDALKKDDRAQARKLLDELNELPTRANMNQLLENVAGKLSSRSENPRVQAKIEMLFAESRKLLSNFLSTREIIELEVEVMAKGVKKDRRLFVYTLGHD